MCESKRGRLPPIASRGGESEDRNIRSAFKTSRPLQSSLHSVSSHNKCLHLNPAVLLPESMLSPVFASLETRSDSNSHNLAVDRVTSVVEPAGWRDQNCVSQDMMLCVCYQDCYCWLSLMISTRDCVHTCGLFWDMLDLASSVGALVRIA